MVAMAYVYGVAAKFEVDSERAKAAGAPPPPPPNCINCGAAHQVGATECTYCRTPLPIFKVLGL